MELDLKSILRIATGIAQGLKYIHSQKVFHRDMKSMNVLLDNDFRAKIADFGMSKTKSQTTEMTQSTVGTYAWMAPEVMLGEQYNEKVDTYSFGVILWEMVTNQLPFAGVRIPNLVKRVAFDNERLPLPSVTKRFPRELAQLIEGCWDRDPSKRKALDEILTTLLQIETDGIPNFQSNSFQLNPVDSQSPEFERLNESFFASMQQHHADYVYVRITSKLPPVSF